MGRITRVTKYSGVIAISPTEPKSTYSHAATKDASIHWTGEGIQSTKELAREDDLLTI